MNKTLKLLLIISLLFGCKKENSKIPQIEKKFHNLTAVGELKNSSYTFCGTLPTKVNYSYRIGKWKFITKEKIKIAEGEYDIIIKENNNSGGCVFKYFENKVDIHKWKFWNKEGKLVKPTKQLLNIIESKQTKFNLQLE